MPFFKCPNCGRVYGYGDIDDNVLINCLNCRYPLKKAEDITKVRHPELSEHKIIGTIDDMVAQKPKCPTCNSTNIKKISIGRKIFGGTLFGLFSSDVRNTMCCKNCGYKW